MPASTEVERAGSKRAAIQLLPPAIAARLRNLINDRRAGKVSAMETATTNAAPEFRVGSEKLIKATEAAGGQVRKLLDKHQKPAGALRISIVGGGCSGLSYKMDLADAPKKGDIVVETAGAKILVDQKSALYVTGSSLDYVDAMIGGGFRMKNPNATATCSCGESFSV